MVFKQPPHPIPAIADLLPHGAQMTFLDELTSCSDGNSTATVSVAKLQKFADDQGNLPTYLGLECMVQTVAAMVGLGRYEQGLSPLVGLILGTRNCQFYRWNFPAIGTLVVSVNTVMLEEPLGVFAGQVCCDDVVYVDGQVKAIQPKTEAQLRALLLHR